MLRAGEIATVVLHNALVSEAEVHNITVEWRLAPYMTAAPLSVSTYPVVDFAVSKQSAKEASLKATSWLSLGTRGGKKASSKT